VDRTICSGRGSTRSSMSDTRFVKLGKAIDWRFLEDRFGAAYSDRAGHPPLPTRLMAALAILKSMHDLSDEDLCARWLENPYFQLFCGEGSSGPRRRSTARH
jgi:IS5 family transposase